jgi:hypothetical protein
VDTWTRTTIQQLLALIGEQLDGGEEEVCGIIVSVRYNGDVISIWNKDADNQVRVWCVT